ncbi:MAG: peptide deformylase [Oscillospiraceae bacterium]|nr:peptide deformylase [Oscillospiraceae bacterium]
MALRKIHKNGEAALRKKAKPVAKFDSRLAVLVDDMKETLKDANGIGLAAPQVGVLKRIIVINAGVGGDEAETADFIELINPVISERVGEQVYYEGCLSYPGYYGNVGRPQSLIVRAFNSKGEPIEYAATGLFAVACCHEADHLEGEMFMPKVKGPLYTLEEVKALREKAESDKAAGKTVSNAGGGPDDGAMLRINV